MARKSNFASMSVAALLKMRDDIGEVLSRRATDLKKELSQLADWGAKGPESPKGPQRQEGRSAIPQQERSEGGVVRPRRHAALDESRNERHQAHQRKLPDQIIIVCRSELSSGRASAR